jgi:hypothetical protein
MTSFQEALKANVLFNPAGNDDVSVRTIIR